MEFHKHYPVVEKDSYRANENVDIDIKFPQRQLRAKSITVNGDLTIKTAAGANSTAKVYIDNMAGVKSLFTNCTTTLEYGGQVENLNNFSVSEKITTQATVNKDDIVGQLSQHMELKASSPEQFHYIQSDHSAHTVPFSFRPNIALNSTFQPIPSNRTGICTLSFRLAPNEVLFGPQVAGHYYEITNLHVLCESEPLNAELSKLPVILKTRKSTEVKVNSSRINIQLNTPQECIGFTGAFIPQASRVDQHLNSLDFSCPNVQKVEYHFNDTSGLVTYPMTTREEVIYNALSLFSTRERNMYVDKLDEVLLGLSFPSISLQERRLTINLEFDAPAAHDLFIVFHSLVKV